MADAVSALQGAAYEGYVTVTEAGRVGMIALRGDLGAAFAGAVKDVTGLDLPGARAVVGEGPRLAWMSPDELMLFCAPEAAPMQALALAEALKGQHALAVEVTDARAVFRVSGAAAREVMAKLTPANVAPGAFGPGEMRRTRLGQVAAAFHMVDDSTFEVIAFRSVAGYVFDLLSNAARPGSEVGHFAIK